MNWPASFICFPAANGGRRLHFAFLPLFVCLIVRKAFFVVVSCLVLLMVGLYRMCVGLELERKLLCIELSLPIL